MNTAVSVLKMNPAMSANMLRPILKECLPCTTSITGKYIDNFRRKVAVHHLKNPNQPMLSMEQCQALTSSKELSKKDFIGMNDPPVRVNLNEMYGKIMQNDSNIWSALQFLTLSSLSTKNLEALISQRELKKFFPKLCSTYDLFILIVST